MPPAPWFKDAIRAANDMLGNGLALDEVQQEILNLIPQTVTYDYRINPVSYSDFLKGVGHQENYDKVIEDFEKLMYLPTVMSGAIMPDACPAGVIPVGGVVASTHIHPGFHSADICCSMGASYFTSDMSDKEVLDRAMEFSHFGPGGRKNAVFTPQLLNLVKQFDDNPYLRGLEDIALQHFATQGDGNHFFFLGKTFTSRVIVTHHGSRGLGAQLYKRGMKVAQKHVPKFGQAAWLPDGETSLYWDALRIVQAWTQMNHFAIHDLVLRGTHQWREWNAHNFVFQKPDDPLFYHAKGATPNFDDDEVSLIPMNMAQPILVVAKGRNPVGFAPHGAGRNMSRTAHKKLDIASLDEVKHLDVRFYSGKPDLSELPSAYKDAPTVMREIKTHQLAEVIDLIQPIGCIMAGEFR